MIGECDGAACDFLQAVSPGSGLTGLGRPLPGQIHRTLDSREPALSICDSVGASVASRQRPICAVQLQCLSTSGLSSLLSHRAPDPAWGGLPCR